MAKQYILSERDYNRIQDALRWVERNKNLRPQYRRRGGNVGGGGSSGIARRAKTQEAATATGKISVKLLDAAGDVTGDAVDVYAFADKAANDMSDYLPTLALNDYVLVSKLNDGEWYLVNPTLIEFTECP